MHSNETHHATTVWPRPLVENAIDRLYVFIGSFELCYEILNIVIKLIKTARSMLFSRGMIVEGEIKFAKSGY